MPILSTFFQYSFSRKRNSS